MSKLVTGKFGARWFLICVLLPLLSSVPLKAGQGEPTAEQRLDGLLAALGGREAWAQLSGVRVTATHHTTTVRLPFKNVIWLDFMSPRHRIEATNEEINRALLWQKSGDGWIKRDAEKTRPLTAQEETDEGRWWESHPYRTIRRLAARDPELSVKLLEPDRLAVFRKDGVRLCWYRLNQLNEPVAFGIWDSEEGTIFGPLKEAANFGVRHPKWTVRPEGRWRAEMIEFFFFREKMSVETARPKG